MDGEEEGVGGGGAGGGGVDEHGVGPDGVKQGTERGEGGGEGLLRDGEGVDAGVEVGGAADVLFREIGYRGDVLVAIPRWGAAEELVVEGVDDLGVGWLRGCAVAR